MCNIIQVSSGGRTAVYVKWYPIFPLFKMVNACIANVVFSALGKDIP